MIALERGDLHSAPHIVFEPVDPASSSPCSSLNYLGDVVRARFDVRESAI